MIYCFLLVFRPSIKLHQPFLGSFLFFFRLCSRHPCDDNISVFRILKSCPWAPENPLFTSRTKLALFASNKNLYMDIRISRFDFLRIEHLTQVEDFSSLADFGASVDHYNVLKSGLSLLMISRE
jgi:hypothetical protein